MKTSKKKMDLDYFCQANNESQFIKTAKQAEDLRSRRWKASQKLGIDKKLGYIARWVGEKVRPEPTYGPQRTIQIDDVFLHWDGFDGSNCVEVMVGDKIVYSTALVDLFIIPGPWLKTLLALEKEANEAMKKSADHEVSCALQKALKKI